jgi:hypothetical protein
MARFDDDEDDDDDVDDYSQPLVLVSHQSYYQKVQPKHSKNKPSIFSSIFL